jgi:hypothetical protein
VSNEVSGTGFIDELQVISPAKACASTHEIDACSGILTEFVDRGHNRTNLHSRTVASQLSFYRSCLCPSRRDWHEKLDDNALE